LVNSCGQPKSLEVKSLGWFVEVGHWHCGGTLSLLAGKVKDFIFTCQAKVEMSYCYQSRNVLFRGLG